MYSLQGVKKRLSQPRFILQGLNRLYYQRLRRWEYNRKGVNIFEADWDNLLILDACRHDLFENVTDLPGETTTVESRGSATREFLRGNFHGQELFDTVYVTASPMLSKHRDKIDVQFHDVINLWQAQGWDDQYRTVLPDTVVDATLDAAEQFPKKRLLVHFIQPQYPFLGPTGRKHCSLDSLSFQWADAATGDLDISDAVIRRAYKENLEEVLPAVEQLLFQLKGKTIVTSDHGQGLGERLSPIPIREYGHPPGLYTEQLVTVPWHLFDKGPRREITAEEPTERETTEPKNEELATKRLRDLGYLN